MFIKTNFLKKLLLILFFTTTWSNASLSDISLDTDLKGKTIFCYYSSPDKLAEMLGAEFINSKQVNLAISDKVAIDFQIYKSTYQIKEFYYKPSLDGKKKIYTPVINIKFPNIKVRYDVDQIEIFSSKNTFYEGIRPLISRGFPIGGGCRFMDLKEDFHTTMKKLDLKIKEINKKAAKE